MAACCVANPRCFGEKRGEEEACTVLGDGGLRLCDESDMLSSTWFHSDEVQELLGFFFLFWVVFF